MKHLGSEMFGTTEIQTDEAILLAKTMKENGSSNEQIINDISLIDDLLVLQKVRILAYGFRYTATGRIRKDSDFLSIISNRIEQDINN